MSDASKRAPDQDDRDVAVAETRRNVLIDAGAGTGKTTLLVDRLLARVAPLDDAAAALDLDRIAAVTFTRRAAGELRLRIREQLLAALARADVSALRRRRLHDALGKLDTAHVGTIHSFADRLLRLHPIEAGLSPSYVIAEDRAPLVQETFALLLAGAEAGTLAASLAGDVSPAVAAAAAEAEETLRAAVRAGLRAQSAVSGWVTRNGLYALVDEFLEHRDVPPPFVAPASFDLAAFRGFVAETVARCAPITGPSPGAAWLRRLGERAAELAGPTDPAELLREANRLHVGWPPAAASLGGDFGDDAAAWDVWKAWLGDKRQARIRSGSLREDLLGPLHRWMATRLVRAFPVIVAVYERVKARHRAVDQIDLLLGLRALLRDDLALRGQYQRLFDHVFVDEFQDTDPLQAEVVLYLCEREPAARRWQDVVLADGKLTLVGDPKQSIYRFRRADVAMYDEVRRLVLGHDAREVTLAANFRSTPGLIAFLNHRFRHVLELPPTPERKFDPLTGKVFHQDLLPGRAADTTVDAAAAGARVHIMPFDAAPAAAPTVEALRTVEAKALARYLRWLVRDSGITITDPLDRALRPVRLGDVAILAITTTSLPQLFPELDDLGIAHAARGGRLFLDDPLHRQFLLGLRAIADPGDGVAQAALYRPPFFAVDLAEVVAKAPRALAVGEWVGALRRRRFERAPGATARDLLEETGFGRVVALAPNGAQRLARLRELCLLLEQTAADEGLDYDAVTARLRAWVDDPVALDPPHPVGGDAVQIMTVHQAKGLEFPVVVMWDARAQWIGRADAGAWRCREDGVRPGGWMVDLDGLSWEEPRELGLRGAEKLYRDAEKRRVVYVAATRARDLLVLPLAGAPEGRYVSGELCAGADPAHVHTLAPYRHEAAPAGPAASAAAPETTELAAHLAARWEHARRAAERTAFRPIGVSHTVSAGEAEPPAAIAGRPGRHGRLFGDTVHRAIGRAIGGETPAAAVTAAARGTGLVTHHADAVADVVRALAALRAAGILDGSMTVRLEYPVTGSERGALLQGYIDLIAASAERLDVIDFKTDVPPSGNEIHGEHVQQVTTYVRLLHAAGLTAGRTVRAGLLYTADVGRIRWV